MRSAGRCGELVQSNGFGPRRSKSVAAQHAAGCTSTTRRAADGVVVCGARELLRVCRSHPADVERYGRRAFYATSTASSVSRLGAWGWAGSPFWAACQGVGAHIVCANTRRPKAGRARHQTLQDPLSKSAPAGISDRARQGMSESFRQDFNRRFAVTPRATTIPPAPAAPDRTWLASEPPETRTGTKKTCSMNQSSPTKPGDRYTCATPRSRCARRSTAPSRTLPITTRDYSLSSASRVRP